NHLEKRFNWIPRPPPPPPVTTTTRPPTTTTSATNPNPTSGVLPTNVVNQALVLTK
ncbi:hypothetical protein HDV05_002440, partial [Chytridiales sp. JEL 0842]